MEARCEFAKRLAREMGKFTLQYFDADLRVKSKADGTPVTMADRGAEMIAGHIRRQKFAENPVQVVLSGSMHTKLVPDWYVALLKEKTEEKAGRPCFFSRLTVPPVTGCIHWMLENRKKAEE